MTTIYLKAASQSSFDIEDVAVVRDYASLVAALADMDSSGRGVIYTTTPLLYVADTLILPNNVRIVGQGGDKNHDIGGAGARAKTKFVWSGAAGGTMVSCTSTAGAGNQIIYGSGLENIYFNANGAATGVSIRSLFAGRFRNLFGLNCTSAFFDVGVVSTLGEAEDVQHCLWENVGSRNDAVTAPDGGLFILDGDTAAGANTSYNKFVGCIGRVHDGIAYQLNNCDNNLFIQCRSLKTGTGSGVLLNGSNTTGDVARNNIFFHYGGAPAITAKGTASFTYPSYGNRFICLDDDNGTPAPTVETGATCVWDWTEGTGQEHAFYGLAVGDSVTNARDARTNRGTNALAILSNSEAHAKFMRAGGIHAWLMRVLTTGEFDLTSVNASADVRLGAPTTKGVDLRVASVSKLRVTATAATANAADFVANTAANGLVLKDTQATPHYWRLTINAAGTGALVITDIGTTAP